MLSAEKEHIPGIIEKEGYSPQEIISPSNISVYVAEKALRKIASSPNKRRSRCQTLTRSNIDSDLGIDIKSFDGAIDEMNRIQDSIIWGGTDE